MGRPSLGQRDRFNVRPPADVGQRIRDDAKAAGLSHGEFICRVMADLYNLPYATPGATIHHLENQTALELPMTG